jgi:hypothetical protein
MCLDTEFNHRLIQFFLSFVKAETSDKGSTVLIFSEAIHYQQRVFYKRMTDIQ